MKRSVRAESLILSDKPPPTWAVVKDKITFKQQRRSSKPEVGYNIASENKYKIVESKLEKNKKNSIS